jgi:hypothetical protein
MIKYLLPFWVLCFSSCSILYPQKQYADFKMGGGLMFPKHVKFVTIEKNISIDDKNPEFIYDNPMQFLSPLNIGSASLTHRDTGNEEKFTIEFFDLSKEEIIGKREVMWVERSCILSEKIFYHGSENKLYNKFSIRILPKEKSTGRFRFNTQYMIVNGKHTWSRNGAHESVN